MLSIIYNGIKPNEYKFEYSVIGNNNVDYIDFSFSNEIPSGDCYALIESKDKSYVDKIALDYNNGHYVLPLLAKTTAHKVIKVQLSIETNEIKWQTEIVEIMLKNSIKADEEIENDYPSVLEQLQASVHNPRERRFVEAHKGRLFFNADSQVLLTENVSRQTNCIQGKYIDTKKGNRILEDFVIQQGEYTKHELVELLLDSQILTEKSLSQVNDTIHNVAIYDSWNIDEHRNYGKVFYEFVKEELFSGRMSSSIKMSNYYSSETKNIAVIKLQFKFVKNFQLKGDDLKRGWRGTMANCYAEVVVFAFRELDSAFATLEIKSF